MTNKNPEQSNKTAARPWHRQAGETDRQFQLFEFFLSLEPLNRSSQNVARQFAVSDRYIKRIRTEKDWNKRVAARDNHLADKADKAAEKVVEKVAFDWEAYEQENLANSVELSRLFADKAREIALMPVTETTETITETTEDGKTIHKTVVHKPLRVTAADAPKFAEAALILSRYAIEQGDFARRGTTENIHLPKPPKPLDQMTQEERAVYMDELQAARESLIRGDGVEFISGAEQ